MSNPPIGIDIGTTNSLIAVFEDGTPKLIPNPSGDVLTPSVVALNEKAEVVVGAAARSMKTLAQGDAIGVFKRAMGASNRFKLGRKKFGAEDLSALVLRQLKDDAETYLGQTIQDVVISVPAYFNEVQRRAVRNACSISGLNPIRLINEPTAAALAYGLKEREDERTSLIFDLGGGTFDVSILETFEGVFEIRSSAGDAALGGEDFTQAIVSHLDSIIGGAPKSMTSSRYEATLYNTAELMKRALSKQEAAEVDIELDGVTNTLCLTRETFDQISEGLFEKIRRPIERALYDADLSITEVDRVLLVGGATRMTSIRSFVAKMFGKLPEGRIDPDHVVALGAATQAAFVAKDEALEDLVMTDVSAFSLGINTSRELSAGWITGFFSPVIERNYAVPTSKSTKLQVARAGQSSLEVQIYQGEAPMVADNIYLGGFHLPMPVNHKEREHADIRFTYDVSGLLEVEATTSDDLTRRIVIEGDGAAMSDKEVADRLKALEKLKVHPRDETQNTEIIARLKSCYEMANGVDRSRVMTFIESFEDALNSQETSSVEQARIRAEEFIRQFEDGYVR